MNAIRIGKVWLNEGPLDGVPIYAIDGQDLYAWRANGREHLYSRIGTTNSFIYAGAKPWNAPDDCGPYEVASTSLFQDERPVHANRFRLASINWIHKLRSLMG